MTPEQEQMFKIQNSPEPMNIPTHMVQMGEEMVGVEGVEEVNHGLALGMEYMRQNGPTQAIHRGKAKMMTKQQLEEQRMNEAKGLPSNLEEAGRVVGLEQKVSEIGETVNKLATVLGGFIQSQQPPNPYPLPTDAPITHPRNLVLEIKPTPTDLSQPPRTAPVGDVGQPHTPQEKPVAEPLDSSAPNGTLAAVLNPPTPLLPVLPTVKLTGVVETPESVPDSSRPVTPPQASQETQPPTPSMALGPVGTPGPVVEHSDQFQLTEESSPGSDVSVLVEEEAPQVDPVEQKRLERQQILTDQVTDWLKSKDPHKFWRQFIAGSCNKNLSYNTWPKEFQDPFNERFQAMITDPIFIASLCGKVVKFQNGHLVAAHVMGAFIVATAGFLSFALIEV